MNKMIVFSALFTLMVYNSSFTTDNESNNLDAYHVDF